MFTYVTDNGNKNVVHPDSWKLTTMVVKESFFSSENRGETL